VHPLKTKAVTVYSCVTSIMVKVCVSHRECSFVVVVTKLSGT